MNNLAAVSANDLKVIKGIHDAAEDAEVQAFNPAIDAATGDAATALQVSFPSIYFPCPSLPYCLILPSRWLKPFADDGALNRTARSRTRSSSSQQRSSVSRSRLLREVTMEILLLSRLSLRTTLSLILLLPDRTLLLFRLMRLLRQLSVVMTAMVLMVVSNVSVER